MLVGGTNQLKYLAKNLEVVFIFWKIGGTSRVNSSCRTNSEFARARRLERAFSGRKCFKTCFIESDSEIAENVEGICGHGEDLKLTGKPEDGTQTLQRLTFLPTALP